MSELPMTDGSVNPDTPLQSSGEEQNLRIVVACAVALVAMLACPILTGETYTGNDLRDFHIPVREFYARCLRTGDGFAWMPGVFCGFYIHGEGQAGMYHPLHYALYRFLPLEAALGLEMALSFPAMLAGMYLLLRRWNLRRDACAFGALVLAFSGFNSRHFVHVNALSVMAHVPWILLAIDWTLRCDDRARARVAAAAVALLTGSQILMGYPQYVWFSLLAEAAYAIALARTKAAPARIALVLAAKAVGLAVGAAQLLPTFDAWSDSVRVTMSQRLRNEFSMSWLLLSQMVAPYLLSSKAIQSSPQEYGIYLGAAVPPLVMWFLLSVKRLREHRRIAVMSVVLAVVALDLSFGSRGLLDSYVSMMPLAGLFRAPVRYFADCQLGFAVAAALAVHDIARRAETGEKSGAFRTALLLVPLVWALAGIWRIGWSHTITAGPPLSMPYSESTLAVFAGPALVLCAAVLIAASARSARPALAGLMVFAAVDLGVYGGLFLGSSPVSSVEALAGSIPDPPEGEGRIASAATASDVWLLEGRNLVGGYAALMPRKCLDYSSPEALRVAGARWVNVSDYGRPEAAELLEWRQVGDPMPRARLVTGVLARANPGRRISLDGVDVVSTVILDEAVDVDAYPAGTVVVTRDDPGCARFRTAAPGRQVLVFSESWHRGWKARVDGVPARAMRAYGDFIAVAVEAGAHDVELVFAPASLAAGLWASLVSSAVVVACAAWSIRTRKRQPGFSV